eukprot:4530331-Prymnesium_polylepis.1
MSAKRSRRQSPLVPPPEAPRRVAAPHAARQGRLISIYFLRFFVTVHHRSGVVVKSWKSA